MYGLSGWETSQIVTETMIIKEETPNVVVIRRRLRRDNLAGTYSGTSVGDNLNCSLVFRDNRDRGSYTGIFT